MSFVEVDLLMDVRWWVFLGEFCELLYHVYVLDYFGLKFLVFDLSERRMAESGRIREKYPDRVPVRITMDEDNLL